MIVREEESPRRTKCSGGFPMFQPRRVLSSLLARTFSRRSSDLMSGLITIEAVIRVLGVADAVPTGRTCVVRLTGEPAPCFPRTGTRPSIVRAALRPGSGR